MASQKKFRTFEWMARTLVGFVQTQSGKASWALQLPTYFTLGMIKCGAHIIIMIRLEKLEKNIKSKVQCFLVGGEFTTLL